MFNWLKSKNKKDDELALLLVQNIKLLVENIKYFECHGASILDGGVTAVWRH